MSRASTPISWRRSRSGYWKFAPPRVFPDAHELALALALNPVPLTSEGRSRFTSSVSTR